MTEPSSPLAQPEKSASLSSRIPPIIGSILLLLPMATCVQAWLADSPGKIWLTAFAVVAIAIGIVAWRFRASLVLWCGLIVSSALVVAPAYLYGVDGAELAVAGIPFRIFIPCLFLVSLVLAAWELARLPRLPLWARYVAPVIALFAAIPVVMGLMRGVPFTGVLAGLWGLPYWIQGGWLGAAVLLPIALLVSLLRTAIPAWRATPFRQTLALGTIAVFLTATLATGFTMTKQGLINTMAFVPVRAYSGNVEAEIGQENNASATSPETTLTVTEENAPQSEISPTANTASAPQVDQAARSMSTPTELPPLRTEDLGGLVDLIVANVDDLPRAEFDPAALVDVLGGDPQELFQWVRDRTWWAPYRGLLRGSKGVMLDRVGSNLDRAVLLGDLLRRAGHTVRLAHAELSEDRARELLGKVRPIPEQRRSPIAAKPVSADRQRAIESFLPGREKTLQQRIADSKRRSTEGGALVRSQADQLLATVRGGATRNDADNGAAIAALQDHWWVEREQDGNWVAMDVLLADAGIGDALTAASSTSEWKAADAAPSIPETDWHTVGIRVVVERYESGSTSESTVLESLLRPAETLEQPIVLRHMPKPWPDAIPEENPNALRNAALAVKEWVPFLQIGTDVVAQHGFANSGDLKANPFDPIGGSGGGGLFGGFGSALGGGEAVESYASAEWIDYEIRVPGKPNQHLRRTVFDLLGPARRSERATGVKLDSAPTSLERFDALSSYTDILLQPCDFTSEFVAHLMTASIIANQAAFKELSQEQDGAKAKSLAFTILGRIAMWGPLPDLVLWRSALGSQPRDWFIDRPNVLNYRVSLPLAGADQVTVRELIDIASNPTGVRRDVGKKSFKVRVEQGVADTVAEMLALGDDLRMADNTASVFAMAGAPGTLIGAHDASAVKALDWPADTVARISDDVDAGFMAVVPNQPVLLADRQRVGWWRVNPASGETIGVMDTGYHAAMTEEEITRSRVGMQNYLKRDAKQWANLRKVVQQRLKNGQPVGDSILRDLAIRDLYRETVRTLISLGF